MPSKKELGRHSASSLSAVGASSQAPRAPRERPGSVGGRSRVTEALRLGHDEQRRLGSEQRLHQGGGLRRRRARLLEGQSGGGLAEGGALRLCGLGVREAAAGAGPALALAEECGAADGARLVCEEAPLALLARASLEVLAHLMLARGHALVWEGARRTLVAPSFEVEGAWHAAAQLRGPARLHKGGAHLGRLARLRRVAAAAVCAQALPLPRRGCARLRAPSALLRRERLFLPSALLRRRRERGRGRRCGCGPVLPAGAAR
eukprot:scaffold69921_cov61-Phaeocystis_antarctica.AAC.2